MAEIKSGNRKHLETAITEISQRILRLSSTIDEALFSALAVCYTKDSVMAQEIINNDKNIDIEHKKIEDYCAQTIATEQPVATQLRYLIACIKVVAALERIGDYVRHICKNSEQVSAEYFKKYTAILQEMIQTCSRMIKGAIDSFLLYDENLAYTIADMDKTIDTMHLQLYKEILTTLEDDKDKTESSLAFINIIRALERTGDMIANICEHTIYVCTGEHKDLN